MIPFGGASLLGLVVALVLIQWLAPLNKGAMALVILLCLSFANVLTKLFLSRKRDKP